LVKFATDTKKYEIDIYFIICLFGGLDIIMYNYIS